MVGWRGSECHDVVLNSCVFFVLCFFGMIEFVTKHILQCPNLCHCVHNEVHVAH